MITWVKLLLKFRGLGATIHWVRRSVDGLPVEQSVDPQQIEQVEHAVALAGALHPGRALCLEQSLVLYYFLRRAQVAVKFVMGVQPYPLLGHSWVEFQGKPINDVEEHVKWFSPLPDVVI